MNKKRESERAKALQLKRKQEERAQARALRYRPTIIQALDAEDLQIRILENGVEFKHINCTVPKDAVLNLWDEFDFQVMFRGKQLKSQFQKY